MATYPLIGHFGNTGQNVAYMPDPKTAMLATCLQLVREIAGKCPLAIRECDELTLWLETMDRANGLQRQSYTTPRDYSHCPTIYDAIVEALKAHDGQMTEAELYEALISGNAPKSKLAGFMGNFRRALSNKERDELEIEKNEAGSREEDIIRLRHNSEKPKRIR